MEGLGRADRAWSLGRPTAMEPHGDEDREVGHHFPLWWEKFFFGQHLDSISNKFVIR